MKKQILTITLSILAVFAAIHCISNNIAAAGTEKTYELNFQCQYNSRHYSVQTVIMPWIKNVEEKSGGRLKIHLFNQGAIVKEEETFDGVKNGLIDIGTLAPGRLPGKFPLMDITSVPLLFPNTEVGSAALWDLFNSSPEMKKEFEGTIPLFMWISPVLQINTVKKPVMTLSDMEGLKLIGWIPPFLNLIRALGANPIQVPPMDTYLALERGMADGVATPYAILRSTRLSEVTKHHTTVDLMALNFYGTINPRKFKSLPEDLQKILIETTGKKLSTALGRSLDEVVVRDVAWMKANGHKFYTLPAEEKAKWANAVSPLREKWLKKMESKGHKNTRELLQKLEELIKDNSR